MITTKVYTEQVWDDLFQQLHESIYDGVAMLKSIQKEVMKYDEKFTGMKYVENSLVKGEYENGKWVRFDTPKYTEVERTLPSFKNVFIHDMQRFLADWTRRKNSVNYTAGAMNNMDRLVLDKILSTTDADRIKWFKNVIDYCLYAMTEEERESFGGWLECVIKAVVETTRRIVDLDVNGRYKNAFVVYTAFGIAHPGADELPNIKFTTVLVDEDTAMRMYEGAQMFRQTNFKELA